VANDYHGILDVHPWSISCSLIPLCFKGILNLVGLSNNVFTKLLLKFSSTGDIHVVLIVFCREYLDTASKIFLSLNRYGRLS
jgi:hypothetical protein